MMLENFNYLKNLIASLPTMQQRLNQLKRKTNTKSEKRTLNCHKWKMALQFFVTCF